MYGIYHKQTLHPIIKPIYDSADQARLYLTSMKNIISIDNLEVAEAAEIEYRRGMAEVAVTTPRLEVVK